MNEIKRRGFLKAFAGLAASIGVPFSTLLGALPYDGRKRKTTVSIENSPIGIDRNGRITRYAHERSTGTSMKMTASRQWFQHYLSVLEKRRNAVLQINTLKEHRGDLHQSVERMLMDGWEPITINYEPVGLFETYDLAKHRRLLAEKQARKLEAKLSEGGVIEVFNAPLLKIPDDTARNHHIGVGVEGATNDEMVDRYDALRNDFIDHELGRIWYGEDTPELKEWKTHTWNYGYLTPQSSLSFNKSDLFHSLSLGS